MLDERLRQVIGEWLQEETIPPLIPRENPVVFPERLKSILAIVGPRRAGKTYFLYQLIQQLIDGEKALKREILFVDFEDYRLKGFSPGDIDRLLSVFHQLAGSAPRYLFFDEVQHLPDWSRILRTLHNRQRFKILVSGSNSSLLAGEIATELRGRYEDALLLPFSFREFLRFRKFEFNEAMLHTPAKGGLIRAFDDYLKFGAFPEVIDRDTGLEKQKVLQNYYNTIFYKDIIDRYHIKARTVLDGLMGYLLSAYSELFSVSAFEKHLKSAGLQASKRTISNYLQFLKEVFFIIINEKFSYSPRKRLMNPKKVYLSDWGFSSLGAAFSENRGKTLENLVAVELFRRHKDMYYFKETGECDFLLKKGRSPYRAVQVTWELVPRNEKRELRGLQGAMDRFKLNQGTILTYNQEETKESNGSLIQIQPVWKWLLFK